MTLGQFTNDGVVGGGHSMENPVDSAQWSFVLDINTIVRLVIELKCTTIQQICGLVDSGQRKFAQLSLFHFFQNNPIRLDSDWRFALLDLHGAIVVLSAFLLLLPFSHLSCTFSAKECKKMNFVPNTMIWVNLGHILIDLALVLLSRSLVWIWLERQIKPCIFQLCIEFETPKFTFLCSFELCSKLEVDWYSCYWL